MDQPDNQEAIIKIADAKLGELRMQGVAPRFSATPGAVRSAGPSIGQHNDEVWRAYGLTEDEIAEMRRQSII